MRKVLKQLKIHIFLNQELHINQIDDDEVTDRGRDVETSNNGNNYAGVLDNVTNKHKKGRLGDWWEVTNGNRTITFGASNSNPGDFLRVITKAPRKRIMHLLQEM